MKSPPHQNAFADSRRDKFEKIVHLECYWAGNLYFGRRLAFLKNMFVSYLKAKNVLKGFSSPKNKVIRWGWDIFNKFWSCIKQYQWRSGHPNLFWRFLKFPINMKFSFSLKWLFVVHILSEGWMRSRWNMHCTIIKILSLFFFYDNYWILLNIYH